MYHCPECGNVRCGAESQVGVAGMSRLATDTPARELVSAPHERSNEEGGPDGSHRDGRVAKGGMEDDSDSTEEEEGQKSH
ncbi:hypothetical protein GN956_G12637 [Arapaima gigas]